MLIIRNFGTSFHAPKSGNKSQKHSVLPEELNDNLEETGAYKNGTDQPVQTKWSKCPIKIPGVNFGNSIHNNSTWDKITEGLTKKNSISGTE